MLGQGLVNKNMLKISTFWLEKVLISPTSYAASCYLHLALMQHHCQKVILQFSLVGGASMLWH